MTRGPAPFSASNLSFIHLFSQWPATGDNKMATFLLAEVWVFCSVVRSEGRPSWVTVSRSVPNRPETEILLQQLDSPHLGANNKIGN